ncbi:hypothetical protein, partial [Schaedlerella sp.]|uniref:hypothetical protein n=1 Tax=Schaedlerella sp. TaxID=2676057 RepID=UPI003744D5A0
MERYHAPLTSRLLSVFSLFPLLVPFVAFLVSVVHINLSHMGLSRYILRVSGSVTRSFWYQAPSGANFLLWSLR